MRRQQVDDGKQRRLVAVVGWRIARIDAVDERAATSERLLRCASTAPATKRRQDSQTQRQRAELYPVRISCNSPLRDLSTEISRQPESGRPPFVHFDAKAGSRRQLDNTVAERQRRLHDVLGKVEMREAHAPIDRRHGQAKCAAAAVPRLNSAILAATLTLRPKSSHRSATASVLQSTELDQFQRPRSASHDAAGCELWILLFFGKTSGSTRPLVSAFTVAQTTRFLRNGLVAH